MEQPRLSYILTSLSYVQKLSPLAFSVTPIVTLRALATHANILYAAQLDGTSAPDRDRHLRLAGSKGRCVPSCTLNCCCGNVRTNADEQRGADTRRTFCFVPTTLTHYTYILYTKLFGQLSERPFTFRRKSKCNTGGLGEPISSWHAQSPGVQWSDR